MTEQSRSIRTHAAWGLPIRWFHWALVGLIALAWATGEAEGPLAVVHKLSGYGVFVAIVFRVIWGFVGAPNARFRSFVRPWSVVRAYARDLMALRPPVTAGHNPIGGWMIVLLLSAVAGVVATGLFAWEDGFGGPLAASISPHLADMLTELHQASANVLPVFIAVHVTGVVVLSLLTGRNLVRAMVTSRSAASRGQAAAGETQPAVPQWYSVSALALSLAIVWLIVAQ